MTEYDDVRTVSNLDVSCLRDLETLCSPSCDWDGLEDVVMKCVDESVMSRGRSTPAGDE